MTKVLAICLLFTAALGLTFAARSATTPTLFTSCSVCALNAPITFFGSGYTKSQSTDIGLLFLQPDGTPGAEGGFNCGHPDHSGSFSCTIPAVFQDPYFTIPGQWTVIAEQINGSQETIVASTHFLVQ